MSKPTATKIMLIRHAEKPIKDFYGVTDKGVRDRHTLIVKGWQRAGALVVVYKP